MGGRDKRSDVVISERRTGAPGIVSFVIRFTLPILLVAGGLYGYSKLSKKKSLPPVPRPEPRTLETRVMTMELVDYRIAVRTQGAIRAHSQVGMTAQVGGRVMTIRQEFEEGAFFKEGDILLELDPVDFESALVAAEAQVAQAKLSLAQEQVRAEQARLDWEDLGYDEEPSDLVLRKPQVALARKQVELAEEQKLTAERNLERARVRAPFDGRVLTRSVGVGQTIGPSTPLGEIFATDYSEVRLPVSTRFLPDLTLPEDITDPALDIKLRDALAENPDLEWDARILRTEGALDADTLELFAIARIQDPFGLKAGKVPLRVGQPVIADIPGRVLEGVYVIPREAVSGLNRIRLVDPETLTLGTALISPLWSDEESVVIRNPDIPDGTFLVLTRLVFAPDGGKVSVIEDEESPDGAVTGQVDSPEQEGAEAK